MILQPSVFTNRSTPMKREEIPVYSIQQIECYETLLDDIQQSGGSFCAVAKEIIDQLSWAVKVPGQLSDKLKHAKNEVLKPNKSLFMHRKALKQYVTLLLKHIKNVAQFQQQALDHCMPPKIFQNANNSQQESQDECVQLNSCDVFLLQSKLCTLYPIHRNQDSIKSLLKHKLNTNCQKMKIENNNGHYYLFSHVRNQFIEALQSRQDFEQFIRHTLLKEFLLQYQLAHIHGTELVYTVTDYVDAIICLLVECFSGKNVCLNALKLSQIPNLVLSDGNILQLAIQKVHQLTE